MLIRKTVRDNDVAFYLFIYLFFKFLLEEKDIFELSKVPKHISINNTNYHFIKKTILIIKLDLV